MRLQVPSTLFSLIWSPKQYLLKSAGYQAHDAASEVLATPARELLVAWLARQPWSCTRYISPKDQ
jgi:hypothetical protein